MAVRARRVATWVAALSALLPACALAQAPPAGTAADPAKSLLTESQAAMARGEYDRAVASARDALAISDRAGDRAGAARALNTIAAAQLFHGGYDEALAHLEQALALSRAAGDREGEAEELNNAGTAYFFQARYLDALRAYRAADAVAEGALGAPWQPRRRWLTRTNTAALFLRLGAYETALDLYREAGPAPPDVAPNENARAMVNLGVLYRRLDDPRKALETYAAVARLLERERHRAGEIGVLKNIGIVQALDLGDSAAALDAFGRAVALADGDANAREATQARIYRGETLLRLGDREAARRDLEAALASAKGLGAAEEQWKALYGLARIARGEGRDDVAAARLREALAAIESVRATLQLSSLKTDFLADKRDVYDALVELLASGARPDVAEIFAVLERSRARTFQDRLRRDGGDARPATLAAVQARLAPDTALLEYWVTAEAAAVLWVTRDAAGLARLPLPPRVDDDVAAFTRELSSGSGDGWRGPAAALGERLLAGVEPLRRRGLRHLVVVPDGALGTVPFEALALPGGDGALVVERFDLSYAPSAAVLLRDAPTRAEAWSAPWRRRLVAFGDPVARAEPPDALAAALGAGERAERLPATAEEVRAVAHLVGGRAELHLGEANRKERLVQGGARGVPLVHLGTHAVADERNPERSRILFSPGPGQGGADYLFLKEVYDLDLRGVDLTTVSACDTEAGKVVRGEGLQAFSRALLSAGSRATVTSLWRVADAATTEVMKQFYFELSEGTPKAEALRRAKLRLLRSGSGLAHPRFWAPFVLNGDGLRPIPRLVPWSALATALIALAIGAAALVRRRASRRGGAGRRGGGVEGSARAEPAEPHAHAS